MFLAIFDADSISNQKDILFIGSIYRALAFVDLINRNNEKKLVWTIQATFRFY